MRDYVKRLDRLEDSAAPTDQIGTIARVLVTPGATNEGPCTATCDGVTIKRAAGESRDNFMSKVAATFPAIPGKIRRVLIDQSRDQFINQPPG